MNKRETQDFIVKYLDSYLSKQGFKHRKSNRTEVEYIRKIDKNNFERFRLSTINYYDSHKLRFGFGKRIGAVEDIMARINEKVPFTNPSYKKNTTTLGFGYNSYNGLNKDGCFGYMETEEQVKENVEKVIDFTEYHALPLLNKFNDLREIDKLINGEGDNFWENDWKKPFNLAGRFNVRRLIIAKLSGHKNFDELVDKVYKSIEEESTKNGYPFVYDRNDLTAEIPYTVHFLENIKSLY